MELTQKKRKLELKKHIATIQCANSLSLLQRKISNALLHHAYEKLLEEEEHQITVKTLCQLIGYNSHDHKIIKQALKALISTVIEWNVVDKESLEEDWNASSILASVGIKGSICTYAYSPKMKQLLYMPIMYGRVDLETQAKFKSNYGLALYENCMRYAGLPWTKWFSIDVFRKLMGVPQDKYLIFRDFKKRVIDKSVLEVNDYSDLEVTPELKREKQKVTQIRFTIKQKRKIGEGSLNNSDNKENKIALVKKLTEYGLTQTQILKIQKEYQHDYIAQKINLIESSNSFQQGKIKNLASYLLKALQEDFKVELSSKTMKQKQQKVKQKIHAEKVKQQSESEQAQLQKQHKIRSQIDNWFSALVESNQKEIIDDFEAHLKKLKLKFLLNKYRQGGLENKLIKLEFYDFIKTNFHQHLAQEV